LHPRADDGLRRQFIPRFIPRLAVLCSPLSGSGNQSPNVIPSERNKFIIVIPIELGTKIKNVYPGIVSLNYDKVLRLTREPVFLYYFSF
jgi:hypothetical protein